MRNTLLIPIDDFLQEEWSGTSTELCKELAEQDNTFNLSPAALTKRLKVTGSLFRKEFNIAVEFERKHSKKLIILKHRLLVVVCK